VTRQFADLNPDADGTLGERGDDRLSPAGDRRQTFAIALPLDGVDAGELVEDRVVDPLPPSLAEGVD